MRDDSIDPKVFRDVRTREFAPERTVQEQAVRRSRVWAELGVQCMVSAEQAVLREMCTHGATEGVQDAA